MHPQTEMFVEKTFVSGTSYSMLSVEFQIWNACCGYRFDRVKYAQHAVASHDLTYLV